MLRKTLDTAEQTSGNLATRVNLAGGLFGCLGLSQVAFFQVRDVCFDVNALRWLLPLSYAGAQAVEFAGLCVALALPRPLPSLSRFPWSIRIP